MIRIRPHRGIHAAFRAAMVWIGVLCILVCGGMEHDLQLSINWENHDHLEVFSTNWISNDHLSSQSFNTDEWPGNHVVEISDGWPIPSQRGGPWPPNHVAVVSNTWYPSPEDHNEEGSSGWPANHRFEPSELWQHNQLLSKSWPADHHSDESNEEEPSLHIAFTSEEWEGENHQESLSLQQWPPNHRWLISGNWPAGHNATVSLQWPANHVKECSEEWVEDDPDGWEDWPANHAAEISITWDFPPPDWPANHTESQSDAAPGSGGGT